MKKFLIWILVFILSAGACMAENEANSGNPEDYRRILDLYLAGLAGDEDVLEGNEFNFSAYICCQTSELDPFESVGYTLLDLDADGIRELVIADATEEQLLEGIVFDVWTLRDGEPVPVIQGWERNRLYLTAPDAEGRWGYYQEGSSSAFESSWSIGTFADGAAVLLHALEYNEEAASVWTLDGEPADEQTVNEALTTWPADAVQTELTPFSSLRGENSSFAY